LGITVPPYLHDGPETRQEMAAFQGNVRHYDRELGRLLKVLDRPGLRENTILVVTTDHGAALPMAKGTLRDPGIETLLLVRYPGGGWGQGRRVQDLVSNVDILPTLLQAAGLEVPAAIQGRSFLPLLQGEGAPARDAIFAEKTFHDSYDPMRGVRTERFKYVRYFEKTAHHPFPADIALGGASRELGPVDRSGFEELFDLEADPGETRNLAGQAAYAHVREEMRARLAAWMQDTQDPLLEGPVGSPFYRRSIEDML
jgi:arylsulfatase A-like enzyme